MFYVLHCILILINSDESPFQLVMMIDDTFRMACAHIVERRC